MGLLERLRDGFSETGPRAVDAATGRIVANRLKTLMPAVAALQEVGLDPADEALRECSSLLDRGVQRVMDLVPAAPNWLRGQISRHVGDMLATAIRVHERLPASAEFDAFVEPIARATAVPVGYEAAGDEQGFVPSRISHVVATMRLAGPVESAIVQSRKGFATDPFRPVSETLVDSLEWIKTAGDRCLDRALGGISMHELSQQSISTLRESFHRAASRIFTRSLERHVDLSLQEFQKAWVSLEPTARKQWWTSFRREQPDGFDMQAVKQESRDMLDRLLDVVLERQAEPDPDPEGEEQPVRAPPDPVVLPPPPARQMQRRKPW